MSEEHATTSIKLKEHDDRLNSIDSTLARLEVTLSHAADTIAGLASVVNNRKTDWGALAGWAAVLVAIGVAVYSPIRDSVIRLEGQNAVMAERLLELQSGAWTVEDQRDYKERVERRLDRIEDRALQCVQGE